MEAPPPMAYRLSEALKSTAAPSVSNASPHSTTPAYPTRTPRSVGSPPPITCTIRQPCPYTRSPLHCRTMPPNVDPTGGVLRVAEVPGPLRIGRQFGFRSGGRTVCFLVNSGGAIACEGWDNGGHYDQDEASGRSIGDIAVPVSVHWDIASLTHASCLGLYILVRTLSLPTSPLPPLNQPHSPPTNSGTTASTTPFSPTPGNKSST
jgi:hypothetical protein